MHLVTEQLTVCRNLMMAPFCDIY